MAITVRQWSRAYGRITKTFSGAVVAGMRAGNLIAFRAAKTEFIRDGSGRPRKRVLTNRSGRLRGSIRMIEPRRKGNVFIMGLSANTPYAAIHETGGTTIAHTIRPRNARALRWFRRGKPVFARSVQHPGSRIPPRPYLEPALRKRGLPEVRKQVSLAIETLFAKEMR